MSPEGLVALTGAGCAFAMAWCATAIVQRLRRRARIGKRIAAGGRELPEETAEVVRETPREQTTRGNRALAAWFDARYPLSGGVRTALIVGFVGGLAFVLLVPALRFFGVPPAWSVIVAVAVAGGVGWWLGNLLETARCIEYRTRLLVLLEDFQRMVRFGIGAEQALTSIAGAAPEPVYSSLRRVVLEVDFGVPIGAAVEREALRVRVNELSMLAAILATQSATGGRLSESIDNLANMLRERQDNRTRMKSSTAESRITMIILSLIPFAAVGLQAATQPELVDVLLNDARHLLGIGVTLILLGLALSWMIIRRAQGA